MSRAQVVAILAASVALLAAGVIALWEPPPRPEQASESEAPADDLPPPDLDPGPHLFGVVPPQRDRDPHQRRLQQAMWGATDAFCPRNSCTAPSGPEALRPASIRPR